MNSCGLSLKRSKNAVFVYQPPLSNLLSSFHNKIFGGFWHFLCYKVEQILLKRARLEACSAKVSTWRRPSPPQKEKVSQMRKKSSWYIPKSTFDLKKKNTKWFWRLESGSPDFLGKFFLWPTSVLLVTYKNDFSSKLTLDLFRGSFLYCSLVGVWLDQFRNKLLHKIT